jgi:prepilin-type N-terminal cleavage/methylation domain-containing protein
MRQSNRKSAFTLVELLVVISIILLASSIIFIGGSGGDGAKLSSAQRIVSGIAQGARGQAILKNAPTRLIIYSDVAANEDNEKKLRYFGIVQELTSTADGTSQGWVAATQGTYLPEGVYFNPDASQSSGSTSAGSQSWNKSNTMDVAYPRLTVESSNDAGGQEEYYYYEFDSNGTVSSNFMNNWLVLQAGTLKPGAGGSLAVDFTEEENVNLKTALIFRRAGTTTRVNDPGDIN